MFVLISDSKIYVRHQLLLQTIGPLEMEEEAIETAFLFFLCIPIIVVLTRLQFAFFNLYNGSLHPMSKILDTVMSKKAGNFYIYFHISSIIMRWIIYL